MKKITMLITIAFVVSILSANVFATEAASAPQKDELHQNTGLFNDKDKSTEPKEKDPIKRLEEKKEFIQKQYKEGNITKEKADELTERIDKRISDIKEFDKLPLQQKKEKLSNDFKLHIDRGINDGKISKEEGDKILKDFQKKLEKWDGKEFPRFMKKHDKCDKCDKKS